MNTEIDHPEQEGRLGGKTVSRGQFIKGGLKAAAGAVVAVSPLGLGPDNPGRKILPDVLTGNELTKSGIAIHNTDETELFLRSGVFDFEIFQDARDGKIGGLEIMLVDNDSLSWNAMGELDDEFLRTLGRAIAIDPELYVAQGYKNIRKQNELAAKSKEGSYKRNLEDLRLLDQGELSTKIEDTIQGIEQEVLPKLKVAILREPYEKQIVGLRKRLERIEDGTERDRLTGEIERDLEDLERVRDVLEKTKDRESAVEYFSDNSPMQGAIVHAKNSIDFSDEKRFSARQRDLGKKLDELNSGWREKVYIFTSVGGRLTPKPENSYPEEEWFGFRESPNPFASFNPDSYLVDYSDPNQRAGASFILRHEVGHYKDGKLQEERDTDLTALESIATASKKYEKSGDSSGYPFVFKNKHGITYAKKPKKEDKPNIF